MYEKLHQLDARNVTKIVVEKPLNFQEWNDINDRLIKASFKY
ncbi:MAG: Sua5 family C-terminal domain-containing protein [Gammaproteobacteria bacterium]